MAAIVYMQNYRRRALRRERVFRDRTNPIDVFDDVELITKFRFRREHIINLTDAVVNEIQHPNRLGALLPVQQVCLTLRFYACGTFQDTIGELFHVSQPTASRTIQSVTRALLSLVPLWIQWPTRAVAEKQKENFFQIATLPQVFACVDGTHTVQITRPHENEHEYVNRKNVHSVNVQVICDADMMIIDVVANWPGSVHDARILRESGVFEAMERPAADRPVLGYVLGDSGNMLRTWLMTPLLNPQTEADRAYNFSHSSTRCTVERTIGCLKKRWNCLKMLRLTPVKACDVITVCCMLHNRARWLGLPDPDSDDEADDNNAINDDDAVEDQVYPVTERARAAAGKAERQRLINRYF